VTDRSLRDADRRGELGLRELQPRPDIFHSSAHALILAALKRIVNGVR
jgi:hypothetical protein